MAAEAMCGNQAEALHALDRSGREGLRAALQDAWRRWRDEWQRRRLERELSWLDAHLLRDMGFTDAAVTAASAQREQREFQDRLRLQAGGPLGRWGA